jgi:hypothetical protein
MSFLHMLPEVGMNCTSNRPLLDGTSASRLKEPIEVRIGDSDYWYTFWPEMQQVAIAAAFVFGLGALDVGTAAHAKAFNNARYAACYKKYAPKHGYSPGWIFLPDYCYEGILGYSPTK